MWALRWIHVVITRQVTWDRQIAAEADRSCGA
jgi:hypothetical protein